MDRSPTRCRIFVLLPKWHALRCRGFRWHRPRARHGGPHREIAPVPFLAPGSCLYQITLRRTVGCARSGGSGARTGAINGINSPATAHRKPSSNSLSACTQKFELPQWAINRRAAMFGLARIKELERNPAEAIGKLWSRSETSATSSIGIEISRTTDGVTLSGAHSQRKKRQPSAGRYSRGEAVATGNDCPE